MNTTRRLFCKTSAAALTVGAGFGILPKRVHYVHIHCPITTRSGLSYSLELSQKQLDSPAVNDHIQSRLGSGIIRRSKSPTRPLWASEPGRSNFSVRSRNHANDFLVRFPDMGNRNQRIFEAIPIIDEDIEENETVEFSSVLFGPSHETIHIVSARTIIKVRTGTEWEFVLTQKQMDIAEVSASIKGRLGPGLLVHASVFNAPSFWSPYITFRNHAHDFDGIVFPYPEMAKAEHPPAIDIDIDENELEGIDQALAYRSA